MSNTLSLSFSPSKKSYPSVTISNKSIDETVNIAGIDVNACIESLQYSKEVYHPCHVEAKIQITTTSQLPAIKTLIDFFLSSSVELTLENVESEDPNVIKNGLSQNGILKDTKKNAIIGKNYYVVGVIPSKKRDSATTTCYVNLDIYSKDYLLTLEKYCRTYTGQKLGTHILTDKIKSTAGFGADLLSVNPSQLTLIKYKPSSDKDWVEFRHPYLVQYNESFYDFIARNCNRCGEFLFFEDGKLTMGLPENANKTKDKNSQTGDNLPYYVIDDNDINSISYLTLSDTEKYVGSNYYNYMEHAVKDYFSGKGKEYDWDIAGDEFFEQLNVDGPDSWWKECGFAPKVQIIINNWGLYSYERKITLTEFIFRTITDLTLNITQETLSAKYCNDDFKKAVDEDASDHSDYFDETEQKKGKMIHQFATLPPDNATYVNSQFSNLSSLFYIFVRSEQSKVSQSAIKIELLVNDELAKLRVGERINVYNDNYVIISINGKYDQVNGDSMEIMAIPYTDDTIIPPAYKLAESPKASAQPAFVTDNNDPQYMGRVRVKFPWQSEKENSTPWIRMATPMASTKGGFFARPEKDDEVLVDFRNGDPQHPVVVGALYSAKRPTPHKYKYSYGGVSSTKWQNNCGQSLILRNGTPKDFILGFSPALSSINSFLPQKKINKLFESDHSVAKFITDNLTLLSGGVSLSDAYGITSITTDTAKRNITINSLIGNVSISAFTGISISSPNGDITIEGKNVNIKAYNNLTLESGVNVKNERKRHLADLKASKLSKLGSIGAAAVAGVAGAILKKLTPPIDMTLLRCVWDMILEPKEGTLMVKSNRYLHLEAGDGMASDTSTGFISPSQADPIMDLSVTARLIDRRVRSDIRTAVYTYGKVKDTAEKLLLLVDKFKNSSNIKFEYFANANVDTMSQLIATIYKNGSYSKKVQVKLNNQEHFTNIQSTKELRKYLEDSAWHSRLRLSDVYIKQGDIEKYFTLLSELNNAVCALPLATKQKGDGKDLFSFGANSGYIPSSVRAKCQKAFKDAMKKAYKDELQVAQEGDKYSYQKIFTRANITNATQITLRRCFYELLTSLDFIKYAGDGDKPKIADIENDTAGWNGFVNGLELKSGGAASAWSVTSISSSFSNFRDSVKFWSNRNEIDRWTPEQKGKILISDNPRNTLMLSNDGVWERKDNGFATLKSLLGATPEYQDIQHPEDNEE